MTVDVQATVARAREAWQKRWAEEAAAKGEPPPRRRYVFVFDCDEDELEAVRLALKGRNLTEKVGRIVPPGWVPGERL